MRTAEIEKQRADIDLEIDLMKTKDEHEAARMEHQILVGVESVIENQSFSIDLPNSTAEENTSTFVARLRDSVP